jgi:hypothetical protein
MRSPRSRPGARADNAGEIVGLYCNATGFHGYLDSGGAFTNISDPLGVKGTQPEGINDSGQIVGVYFASNPRLRRVDRPGGLSH